MKIQMKYTSLADFLTNATWDEREKVFKEASDKANEDQRRIYEK